MAASASPNILWHNSTNGAIKIMPISSMSPEASTTVVSSSNINLLPRGIGDFTGDGKADILFHNGQAISVEIPQTVVLKIVETPPNFKGDSQGGKKPATLESGAVVQVPFHVLEGEMIKVDTVEGKYLEKAK